MVLIILIYRDLTVFWINFSEKYWKKAFETLMLSTPYFKRENISIYSLFLKFVSNIYIYKYLVPFKISIHN